ncbi:helix-turn-helix domain-containing protein [Alistipes indistinctus]|uniref:helix-turn-helix domain-containing protein n=1 Tax=Alistipes indistinctus TaxID=626932 RepID=UPI003A87A2FE
MDSQDVCQALGITKRTLQSYREKGIVPYSNVGGKFFYRENDIAAYLESRTKRKEA